MRISGQSRQLDLEHTISRFERYFADSGPEQKKLFEFFKGAVALEEAYIDGECYTDNPSKDFIAGRWNGHDPEKISVRLGLENNEVFLQLVSRVNSVIQVFNYQSHLKLDSSSVQGEFQSTVREYLK